MDFTYTAEQEEMIRTLRTFAKRELAPHSLEWDGTREFPWKMWRQMGELGLFGLRVASEFGGQEADLLTTGIAIEEIARGDFSCTGGMQLALGEDAKRADQLVLLGGVREVHQSSRSGVAPT